MKYLSLMLILIVSFSLFAERIQETTIPTAGILQKGEAEVYTKIYKDNGLIAGASVGLFDHFMFGVSYGGEEIVGNNEPLWHNKVDFNAKLRVFNETLKYPAIVIGFDSQGHGKYYKEQNRYDLKSRGFYAVASKNYQMLGTFGLDGGINYSLENKDDDKDLNIFLGAYKSVGDIINLVADYDFALNDNSYDEVNNPLGGKGHGYLNVGVELKINELLIIRAMATDISMNRPNAETFDRSVVLNYRWKY